MSVDCTVVVATRDRCATLARALARLLALPERPPLVVVDDGSRDGTAAFVASRFPEVRVVRMERNRGAAARTAGVRAATTRFVAFCDDDCAWRAGAIARGVALLDAHPDVGLLNAKVLVRGDRIDPACALMAESPFPKRSTCPGRAIGSFMAGASIVRRDAYLDCGGYHERYHLGAEESLLALDLLARGWELIYADDLVVEHEPAQAGRAPAVRRRRVLRNRLWTAWLRRSLPAAGRATLHLVRRAVGDPVARAALRDALGGIPWILRERRPIDGRIEALLDALVELPA